MTEPDPAPRPTIAILDYGMGNVRSVEKAFERVGATAVISDDHDVICSAQGVVVPGVGAFPEGMRRIRATGLDELIAERLTAAVPVLGICLGMQMLFESSTEHESAWGLGLLPGRVDRLDAPGLKMPQIGWNAVEWRTSNPGAELIAGLPQPTFFYFVNSYAATVVDESDLLGVAEYGRPFTAVVARPPLYGTQFHPEKSGVHGLRLLRNFSAICAATRALAH